MTHICTSTYTKHANTYIRHTHHTYTHRMHIHQTHRENTYIHTSTYTHTYSDTHPFYSHVTCHLIDSHFSSCQKLHLLLIYANLLATNVLVLLIWKHLFLIRPPMRLEESWGGGAYRAGRSATGVVPQSVSGCLGSWSASPGSLSHPPLLSNGVLSPPPRRGCNYSVSLPWRCDSF